MPTYYTQPKINQVIQQQAYEVIRAKITEILGVELEQQYIMNNAEPILNTEVWMERVIPYGEDELRPCAVNVLFDSGSFQNESTTNTNGVYSYFIEVYSIASSSESRDGDELARYQASRLAGVIRQILMASQYKTLGFNPGIIRNRRVSNVSLFRLEQDTIPNDANRVCVARITLEVTANENELTEFGRELQGTDTLALLSCTDRGYVWSREAIYNPHIVPDPCCEFQITLFNSAEKPIYVLTEQDGNTFELGDVLLRDGQGVLRSFPYDPTEIIVTEPCPTICAAGTVNVNGNLFNTVASGGTINVPVRYENGTPVGTIDGGVVEIPNPASCQDATAVLKNTAGTTLLTENIPSGASEDITAPNATAVLRDSAGTQLSSTGIASGASQNITAPNGSVSVRNSLNTEVATGTVLSGGSVNVSAPDATAVLKDTAGNILDTESIPSNVSEDLTAPDGSVTVNGSAFGSVLSGGTTDIEVRQQTGTTQVGSNQAGVWRIDDSAITINGTPFDFVAAEDSLDIDVQYVNGTPVGAPGSGVWQVPNPVLDLVTRVDFDLGVSPLEYTITVDSLTAGTYTGESFSGDITDATFEKNGSPATLPITVVATDTLKITPNADNGAVTLTGTYV
jgi:hypothetical protein